MAADIVLTDLTNGSIQDVDGINTWVGTGVFDKLISAVNSNIKVQYDEGRIVSSDYASVYLGSMQSVLQEAVKYLLEEKYIEAKIETENLNQEAIIAKVRDENGMTIDENGNNQPYTGENTQHYQILEKLKAEITLAGTDNELKDLQKSKDYGEGTATPLTDVNALPQSRWEADMYKAYREAQIGDETVKGFAADAYYKNAKLSQETLFALANAGVITETTTGTNDITDPYTFFATKLKESLENQVEVFVP